MRGVVLSSMGCSLLLLACSDDAPVPSDGSSSGSGTATVADTSTSAPGEGTTTSVPDGTGSTAAATDSTGPGASSGSTSSGGTTTSASEGTSSGSSSGSTSEASSGSESSSGTTGMVMDMGGGGPMCVPLPSDLDILCGDGMPVGSELCYTTMPPLQNAGTFATGLWAGDLDDDADVDLLVLVEFPAAMTVYLNGGLGNLVYDDSYGLEMGADTGTNDVAVADMDGDTWVDAVVAFASPPSLRVMSNDGGGAFGFPLVTALPLEPYAVALADLDGDLAQDAIVGDAMGVSVHFGLGNGSFGMATGYADPALVEGRDVAVADFDGDGLLDVAVAYTQTVAVYLGDGLGGLGVPWTVAIPVSAFGPQDMAVGDVNADTIPDILVADSLDNEVHELTGVGNGTFMLQPVPRLGTHVALGEGNNDCENDIYSRTTPAMFDELTVYPSNGMGGHLGAQTFTLHSGMVDLAVADFDQDTIDDVAFAIGPTGNIGVSFSDP